MTSFKLFIFALVLGLLDLATCRPSLDNDSSKIVRGPDYSLVANSVEELESMSIDKYILAAAKRRSNDVYLLDASTKKSLTMNQFLELSYILAAQLQDLGCKKNTVVGIMSENRLEYPIVIMGTMLAGTTITCYNPAVTVDELQQFFDVAKPPIMFCSPETCVKVKQVAPTTCKIIEFNSNNPLDSILPNRPTKPYSEVKNSPDDLACILYSCGTTGLPKGVALTHKNFVFMLKLEEVNALIQRNGEMTVALTPMGRISGFEAVLSAVVKDETIIVIQKPDPELYLSIIAEYGVRHFTLAPALIPFLLKSSTVKKYDLSKVEFLTLGAAPIKPETEEKLKERLPHLRYIQQLYGMTEATMFTTIKPPHNLKAGTCGSPVPGVQIKILDIETKKILGENEVGELYLKGPSIMKGYYENEAATDRAIDKNGWLRTGDVGYYDKEKDFFVVDRVKDFIEHGIYKVAPSDIEALLLMHPSIDDAAVIGIPDGKGKELPRAYVVKQAGSSVTEEDIVLYIAGIAQPQKRLEGGAEFISEIPKNSTGKVLRRKLRDLWNANQQSKAQSKL